MQPEIPYKLEAGNGNEIALTVLRFRKEAWSQKQAWSSPRAEKGLEPPRVGLRGKNSHPRRVRRKGAVATRTSRLVRAEQKTAKAFLRMEQIAAEARAEGSDLGEIKCRINGKGVVIFTLDSGGIIRDTGKEVFYSVHDSNAERAAMRYAAEKWGKRLSVEKGRIIFKSGMEMERPAPELETPQKR